MRAFCVALATAVTVLLASALGLPIQFHPHGGGRRVRRRLLSRWYTRHSQRRLEYVRRKTGQTEFMEKCEANFAEVRRRRLVRRSHFLTIVAAWVITVPVSALLSAFLYLVLSGLFL